MMNLAQQAQSFDANEINGTQLTKTDLLSLLDDFTHDIRNPLTVISEFASMLTEGVFEDDIERDKATGFIGERTAATFLLVDVLDLLIRAGCDCIEVHRQACDDSHILQNAVLQLDQFNSLGRGVAASPADGSQRSVWCDPALAARSLVHLWSWMRRAVPREVEIDLEILPVSSMQGVLFPVFRHDYQLDRDAIERMTSPLSVTNDTNLTLRGASESGRLAGGDVLAIENGQALALFLPSADEN